MSAFQDSSGAIIDPYLRREHQYSTPYYAYAVGTLLKYGRAYDLQSSGAKAMDHATRCFAGGSATIPDKHGEFFIAPLTSALDLYRGMVPPVLIGTWRSRLQLPLEKVLESFDIHTNNWRTYAMKGEWFRAQAGLTSRNSALAFIRDAWLSRTQRERIADDKWNLYEDRLTDPDSLAVEAVGRANLLALMLDEYNGEFAREIWPILERGTTTALLLQDPTGQCPPNGRTDNHVFNDVLYLLCFEAMAVRADQHGDDDLAARFHRAALLSYRSILRWKRHGSALGGRLLCHQEPDGPGRKESVISRRATTGTTTGRSCIIWPKRPTFQSSPCGNAPLPPKLEDTPSKLIPDSAVLWPTPGVCNSSSPCAEMPSRVTT